MTREEALENLVEARKGEAEIAKEIIKIQEVMIDEQATMIKIHDEIEASLKQENARLVARIKDITGQK